MEILLRSLIRQLCSAEREIPGAVQTLHANSSDKGHSPTLEDLRSAFISIVQQSAKDTYIFIDALDEVLETRRNEVTNWLRGVSNEGLFNLHILVTSRDEIDIRAAMDCIPHSRTTLEEEKVNTDIRAYVRSCLTDPASRLFNLPTELKVEIEIKIGNDACGM